VLAAVQDAVRRHRGDKPLVDDAAIVIVSVA
jgi:hypothetical protein